MRSRGFTLLEFAVCMSLCALLAGGLLTRLADYQRESERVAAEGLLGAMRTALAVRAAQAGAAGAVKAGLPHENPFLWLEHLPSNYQGEYYRPRAGLIKGGHWYFDPSDRTVNFVPHNDTFSSEIPKLLKFKVELLRELDPPNPGERRQAEQGFTLTQTIGAAESTDH